MMSEGLVCMVSRKKVVPEEWLKLSVDKTMRGEAEGQVLQKGGWE